MPEQVQTPHPIRKPVRVFLSYPSKQKDLAEYVAGQLRVMGIESGNLYDEAAEGGNIRDEIKRRIQDSEVVIALVTPDSLRSDWLSYEMGVALGLDRRVIPILMDVTADQLPKQISDHLTIRLEELDRVRAMVSKDQ